MESEETPAGESRSHESFLVWGTLLEGGLILVAWGIESLFPGRPPHVTIWQQLRDFNAMGAAIGVAAGLGLVPLAMGIDRNRWSEFRKIQQILRDLLGPILSRLRWWELLWVGALAGLGEEILFRGVLEPRLGWIASNVLFGLLHPITAVYVLLVIVAGLVFSGLKWGTGGLWGPILAHGVYDFIILVVLAKKYREHPAGSLPNGPAESDFQQPYG